MYWSQDESPESLPVPDDIVDVLFTLDCRRLPVDNSHALSDALSRAVPWLAEIPGAAMHPLYVAGSQNGWERPDHDTGNHILLSRRTKLSLRLPADAATRIVEELPGMRIEVAECPLSFGSAKIKPLSRETTLFSRFVSCDPGQDEESFLDSSSRTLAEMGVRVRKALCGRFTPLAGPGGETIHTRSLLLADLSLEESFQLQRLGLGPNRLMGCGVFVPHKGVEAVSKTL